MCERYASKFHYLLRVLNIQIQAKAHLRGTDFYSYTEWRMRESSYFLSQNADSLIFTVETENQSDAI